MLGWHYVDILHWQPLISPDNYQGSRKLSQAYSVKHVAADQNSSTKYPTIQNTKYVMLTYFCPTS